MGGFDPKEITPLDYGLRDAEKSLSTYTLLFYLNHCRSLTSALEDQAQCDSSSTFSGRGSGILSVFDPNCDADSLLGACLRCPFAFNALKRFPSSVFVNSIQRTTLHILKFAQR